MAPGLAAVAGQTWRHALYVAVTGDDAAVSALQLHVSERSDVGGFLAATGSTSIYADRLTWARRSISALLTNGATANIQQQIATNSIPSGTTIDWTIRIGGATLTQTAYLPSVFLVGAAAATRYADGVSLAIADHIGAAEGGLYIDCQPIDSGAVQILAQIDDGTDDEKIVLRRTAGDAIEAEIVVGGVSQAVLALGAHTGGDVVKVAIGWADSDVAARKSGGALQADTSAVAIPAGLTTLRLGSGVSIAIPLNGHLREVAAFPSRAIMTDTLIGNLVA